MGRLIDTCPKCGLILDDAGRCPGCPGGFDVEARINALYPMPKRGERITPSELAAIVAARSRKRLELGGKSLSQLSADENFEDWKSKWSGLTRH